MTSDHGGKTAAGASERRKIILIVLLVLLTAVLLYQQRGSSNSGKSASNNNRLAQKPSSAAHDPVLMMEKLKEQPELKEEESRNLFAFAAPPPPVAPVRSPQTVVQPEPVCGDSICNGPESYENCPADCQPPPPPEIALKYIGYLQRPEGTVVFLTDGKEVYMGRENDIIANKYRVLKISDQSVELGYLDLDQSRTIPFEGNQGG